jgi:hypothetical protein
VLKINRLLSNFTRYAGPGRNAVDYFPFLEYFPGKWKSRALQHHQEELGLFQEMLEGVQQKLDRGEMLGQDGHCFARKVMETSENHGLNPGEMAYLCGSIFGAGADTTASAISIGNR